MKSLLVIGAGAHGRVIAETATVLGFQVLGFADDNLAINGRNALSWEEKFEFDVWYVEYRTLILDIKILCKTLTVLIKRTGISASDTVIMSKFLGSRKRD